ncbi:MAG: molybdenum cofactor guanylyltransferase [Chloroflexi bacterium]|nr:molybdenum cofactor guanylyltransferase [Chloroflexota bacterium]
MEPFTAVILAGGRSRRMGEDKAWLDAGGQPLIARVAERLVPLTCEIVVVRGAHDAPSPALPGRVVRDHYPSAGPLAGLHAGLQAATTPWILAVACDMPFLNSALIRYLALLRPGYDAIVPYPTGRPEPLHALYHRRCLPAIEECLNRGQRQILAFYPAVRVRPVSLAEVRVFDPETRSFTNANTPQEWEHIRQQARWAPGPDRPPQ